VVEASGEVAFEAAQRGSDFGPELHEEHLTPSPSWRVVITGTIDRYASKWGISRLTHQRRAFLRPVLPFRSAVVSNNRRDQYWSTKLIFKKLCLRLEAVVDVDGSYASMNTNFVLPGSVDLFAVAALAHSTLMTWIYEGYFGALRMGGGFLQVQAPQLRVLPVPDLPRVSEEELDSLVQDVDATDFEVPSHESPDARKQLYALLRLCGREGHGAAVELADARRSFIDKLLTALDATERRATEPAFVIARQDAILAAVENLESPDLTGVWMPLRRTARALRVEITASRERAIVAAVHEARDAIRGPRQALPQIESGIDRLVFALYGLSTEDVEQVLRGHEAPPGVLIEADA
jgi:hypothetical protein